VALVLFQNGKKLDQTGPSNTSASTQTVPRTDKNSRLKEDNWKHGYGHCVSIEEGPGHLMLITEVAKAMASKEAEQPVHPELCIKCC
jgi:hypothetical protein